MELRTLDAALKRVPVSVWCCRGDMAEVVLKVCKEYDGGVRAVDAFHGLLVTLVVLVLVGPSG